MAGKRTGNNKSDAGANSGETHGSGTAANGNSADSGDDSGIPSIDPASLSSDASSDASAGDSAKRKRGRPLGVRNSNGPSARAEKQTASDLTGLLLSIHLALGAVTKIEELKLDEDEAERLGKAVARVNEEFGGVILSPKQTAVINLLTCGCGIYGPRIMAFGLRKKNEAEAAKRGPQIIDAIPIVGRPQPGGAPN
jgi:hypothetical protein